MRKNPGDSVDSRIYLELELFFTSVLNWLNKTKFVFLKKGSLMGYEAMSYITYRKMTVFLEYCKNNIVVITEYS